jgi:hypothetical protein
MEALTMTWNDTPGSAILKRRQFEDIPPSDFLMLQQGPLFSGKLVGDLDSVPGYYGATTDVQFVQNASAIKKLRKTRAQYNLDTYGVLALPFEKRLEAYRASAALAPKHPVRQPNVSKARGNPFKFAGAYGARFGARQIESANFIPSIKKLFAYNNSGVLREQPFRRRAPGNSRGADVAARRPEAAAPEAPTGRVEGQAPIDERDQYANPFH